MVQSHVATYISIGIEVLLSFVISRPKLPIAIELVFMIHVGDTCSSLHGLSTLHMQYD